MEGHSLRLPGVHKENSPATQKGQMWNRGSFGSPALLGDWLWLVVTQGGLLQRGFLDFCLCLSDLRQHRVCCSLGNGLVSPAVWSFPLLLWGALHVQRLAHASASCIPVIRDETPLLGVAQLTAAGLNDGITQLRWTSLTCQVFILFVSLLFVCFCLGGN